MSRGKLIALCLVLQLMPGAAIAQRQGIEELFPARPVGYVTDHASVLEATSIQEMERLIGQLRSVTGAEIAVVTLPTIRDYAPVDVAVALGRAWGVGAKADIGDPARNAGVVVLLVPRREDDPNSGHIFIATGRGVEGIVTDAAAGRIRDRMIPELGRGAYGAGLLTGVRALSERISDGLTGGAPVEQDRRDGWLPLSFVLIVVFVVILMVIIIVSARARDSRRPPRRRPRRRSRHVPWITIGGGGRGGGWGGGGGFGGGGGGFGGFGGGGGFSGGGAGGRF